MCSKSNLVAVDDADGLIAAINKHHPELVVLNRREVIKDVLGATQVIKAAAEDVHGQFGGLLSVVAPNAGDSDIWKEEGQRFLADLAK